jgi:hypothetical protein
VQGLSPLASFIGAPSISDCILDIARAFAAAGGSYGAAEAMKSTPSRLLRPPTTTKRPMATRFFHSIRRRRRSASSQNNIAPTARAEALTVKDAVEAYLKEKHGRDQHLRLARHVLKDEIADKPLASLTEAALDA